MGISFPVIFAVQFVLLTTFVIVLIRKLNKKNITLAPSEAEKHFFSKEINTLQIILFFFSLSYLLRVFYDGYVGFRQAGDNFTFKLVGTLTGFPFDIAPIFVILYYHRRNLAKS